MKILFASSRCVIDPSSGAAIATRELLESLVTLGVDCRAFCMGIFDYHHETRPEDVLSSLEAEVHMALAEAASGAKVPIFDLTLSGVRTTIVPTQSSRADRSPNHAESIAFLDLYEVILDRFQPDVVLTYGGHPVGIELMKRARKRNIPVIFQIHNFAYKDRQAFAFASHILVPSQFSRDYYQRTLGLDAKAIDPPFRLDRAFVAETERKPRYLTFVNPILRRGSPFGLGSLMNSVDAGPISPSLLLKAEARRSISFILISISRITPICTRWKIRTIQDIFMAQHVRS